MTYQPDHPRAVTLLDAAEQVFYTHGDLGLTVRHVAAQAGSTSQAIYTYLTNRAGLVDAMYRRAVAGIAGLLDGLDGAGWDLCDRYHEVMLARPAWWVMLAHRRIPTGVDLEPVDALRARFAAIVPVELGVVLDGLVLAELAGTLTAEQVADVRVALLAYTARQGVA